MKKFEYKTGKNLTEADINKLSKDGWSLKFCFSMNDNYNSYIKYIFERPIYD